MRCIFKFALLLLLALTIQFAYTRVVLPQLQLRQLELVSDDAAAIQATNRRLEATCSHRHRRMRYIRPGTTPEQLQPRADYLAEATRPPMRVFAYLDLSPIRTPPGIPSIDHTSPVTSHAPPAP